MKQFLIALAAAIAIAFLAGGKIHPEAISSKNFKGIWTFQKQDAIVPMLYDYIVRFLPGAKKETKKKLPGPGPKLRPATPNAPPAGITTSTAASKRSVSHVLSNQGVMEYSQQLGQSLDQIPRNPFVEAANEKKYNS